MCNAEHIMHSAYTVVPLLSSAVPALCAGPFGQKPLKKASTVVNRRQIDDNRGQNEVAGHFAIDCHQFAVN